MPKRAGKTLEQQLRQTEADCYNDIAAAIRKHFPYIKITGAQVAGRVNELLRAEEKLQAGDCGPGCTNYPTCVHNQGRHGVVRINCPLWRPKK
jgi:hypothetical protein